MEALPVFAERTVTAINDLEAEKLTPKDTAALKDIISGIDPDTATVIIYATAFDPCGGKKTLGGANKKLCEHILKCGGAAAEFSLKNPRELIKYIQKLVSAEGSEISEEAAQRLAESCRSDLLMIKNEIEKLSAYRFGEKISVSDVNELVSGRLETDAYRLAREISEGRAEEALKTLDGLYGMQKETASLIAVLAGSFLDLYRAKLCLISGRSAKDIEEAFSYKGREFAIKYALRDCAKIPIERLRKCISVLAECDAGVKSLRTDDRVLLEEAVVRMLR